MGKLEASSSTEPIALHCTLCLVHERQKQDEAGFVELINDMTESEHVDQTNQKYNILLIITDGIINDMQKTID